MKHFELPKALHHVVNLIVLLKFITPSLDEMFPLMLVLELVTMILIALGLAVQTMSAKEKDRRSVGEGGELVHLVELAAFIEWCDVFTKFYNLANLLPTLETMYNATYNPLEIEPIYTETIAFITIAVLLLQWVVRTIKG